MNTLKIEYMLAKKYKYKPLSAVLLGSNPDRLKAIEDAGNKVPTEKGWDESI